VGVTAQHVRHPGAHGAPFEADLDGSQVEGVEDQLHPPSHQGGVDLEGVAVQRHRRRLGHHAPLRPQERLVQLRRRRKSERRTGLEALQRGDAGLGVGPAVIDGLDPGGEEPVHLDQVGDTSGLDFDQELVAHCAEEPFDLAPAFGPAGPRVDQADPQHRTGPQQRGGDKATAVVNVGRAGDAP